MPEEAFGIAVAALNGGFQVAAFIEIIPGGLFQIGVTVHCGQVKFLSKFCVIRTFPR